MDTNIKVVKILKLDARNSKSRDSKEKIVYLKAKMQEASKNIK